MVFSEYHFFTKYFISKYFYKLVNKTEWSTSIFCEEAEVHDACSLFSDHCTVGHRSSLGLRSSRQRTIRSNQLATMRGVITALALMALGASAQDESIGTVIGIDLGKCCSTYFRSSATRSLRSPILYRFRKPPL